MIMIKLTVILFPHKISETIEILSHFVPLYFFLNLKLSLDIIYTFSMIN